jgi:hypothetical protein
MGMLQFGQEDFEKLLPHPGLLPIPQPSPTGHPASRAHFLRDVFPRNPRLKDKQDSSENLPVRLGFATRMPVGAGLGRWKVGLDQCPQIIINKRFGHWKPPALS